MAPCSASSRGARAASNRMSRCTASFDRGVPWGCAALSCTTIHACSTAAMMGRQGVRSTQVRRCGAALPAHAAAPPPQHASPPPHRPTHTHAEAWGRAAAASPPSGSTGCWGAGAVQGVPTSAALARRRAPRPRRAAEAAWDAGMAMVGRAASAAPRARGAAAAADAWQRPWGSHSPARQRARRQGAREAAARRAAARRPPARSCRSPYGPSA